MRIGQIVGNNLPIVNKLHFPPPMDAAFEALLGTLVDTSHDRATEFDASPEAQELRAAARADELASLRAIFGDAEMETVADDVVRFLVYRESAPSKKGAKIEEVHIAFLLPEEYPSLPIVFELQGACLAYSDADAIFFDLFQSACKACPDPAIYSLVYLARDLVSTMIDHRTQEKKAKSATSDKSDVGSFAQIVTAEDADGDMEFVTPSSFERIAASQLRNPYYFLEVSVPDIIAEVEGQVGMRVVSVENVLREDLAAKHIRCRHLMGRNRAVDHKRSRYNRSKNFGNTIETKHEYSDPVVAYHGTSSSRISSIVSRGLLIPGQASHVTRKTGAGFYGDGIYASPDPAVSAGYADYASSKRLIVCSTILGRIFNCPGMMLDAPLQAGFDSHISPCGREYVLYNSAQILPVLVLQLQMHRTPAKAAPASPEDISVMKTVPKNNAAFYLGSGRKVLEMAEHDDDDDIGISHGDYQDERYTGEFDWW